MFDEYDPKDRPTTWQVIGVTAFNLGVWLLIWLAIETWVL